MNGPGDQQRNLSKTVSLSRSVVLTQDTCIPSVLILGKLVRVSSGSDGATAAMDLLRDKLLRDWAASGPVNFWPLTDGAFLVQFHQEADIARVMDGAPWYCDDGGFLFLMRQAKPEINLVDQLAGVGFTTADLWVQFHNVPVEYFNTTSLCALATCIGVPVVLPDLGTAPVDLLRARIQVDITVPLVHSIPVNLDDGTNQQVSVVYERVPSLCSSCGIIAHPAVAGRCPKVNQTAAAAASRSRREKPAGYVRSRLGSRTSSSREENQPLLGKEKDGDHAACSSSATAGSGVATLLQPKKPAGQPSADADHHLPVLETPGPVPQPVSLNRCMPCSLLNLISRKKKKELIREKKVSRVTNLQHMPTNHKHQTLLLTFSASQSIQESLTMEQHETSPDRLAISTLSSFQLAGGHVSYYSYSGRRNPRIEVMVETQCSSHLMKKAMEWLAANTGQHNATKW